MNPTEQNILKGCGKETLNLNGNVVEICSQHPKGVFIECAELLTKEGIKKVCEAPTIEFRLCPNCKKLLEGYQLAQNKCAFDNCNNKATTGIGNNVNGGDFHLCKSCYDKYNKHQEARENYFKELAQKETLKQIEKWLLKNGYYSNNPVTKFVRSIK